MILSEKCFNHKKKANVVHIMTGCRAICPSATTSGPPNHHVGLLGRLGCHAW